jgi:hypothetical protein
MRRRDLFQRLAGAMAAMVGARLGVKAPRQDPGIVAGPLPLGGTSDQVITVPEWKWVAAQKAANPLYRLWVGPDGKFEMERVDEGLERVPPTGD